MDRIIQAFNLFSSTYQDSRPRYPNELYSLLASKCKAFDKAGDCACGSGQVAIDLAPYFKGIQVSDNSRNQVRNGFAHIKPQYTVKDSESTNYEAASFDFVCTAQYSLWVNRESFFNEVKRILKKEGHSPLGGIASLR